MAINSLGSPVCAAASQDTILSILETLLTYDDTIVGILLGPHLSALLMALKHTVVQTADLKPLKSTRPQEKVTFNFQSCDSWQS